MNNIDSWTRVKLGEVAIINPKIPFDHVDNNMKVGFVSMADVSADSRIENIQEKDFEEVSKGFTRFQTNDVLFAKITPCMENGKGGFCSDNRYPFYFGSTEFHVLRATDQIIPKYLYYVVNNPLFRIIAERNMVGSAGQKRVPSDFLSNYYILLPPLEIQKKLADYLSTLDALVEETDQIIEKTETLKKGLMQDLFTRGIGHTKFQKTKLEEIPENWNVLSIGRLFKMFSGSTPPRDNNDFFKNGTIPWVKTLDLNNAFINNTQEKITEKGLKNSSCRVFPVGTVLIAMYGGFNQIGRTGVLAIEAATNQAITSLLPIKEIDSLYLNYYLIKNRDRWRRFATSSRKDPNITKNDISKFKVSVPPLKEQKKIVEVISYVDKKIDQEEENKKRLLALKKGLMQDIFSQKVNVQ